METTLGPAPVAESEKVCFVISPIGEPGSETRKRSDLVLKHVFERALEPLGYTVVRADKISQPGLITLQVIERLLNAQLVLADLTGHNPNVFYELAVRHAAEKPVIHVIDSSEVIPFDVSGLRVIKFDHRDLGSVDEAIKDIQHQTGEIEKGPVGETPVKLAAVIQRASQGEGGVNTLLRQIVEGLSELRSYIQTAVAEMRPRGRVPDVAGLGGWQPLDFTAWRPTYREAIGRAIEVEASRAEAAQSIAEAIRRVQGEEASRAEVVQSIAKAIRSLQEEEASGAEKGERKQGEKP
jgi:hypothetical protein